MFITHNKIVIVLFFCKNIINCSVSYCFNSFPIDKTGMRNKKNTELLKLLEERNLSSLAHKFQKSGLTADMVWKLDDSILSNLDLTRLERKKYEIAKERNLETGNCFGIKCHITNILLRSS